MKMSTEREKWTISEEHKKQMSAFLSDFWALIKASYEFPADEDPGHDHYWETLVKWNDALITKYKSDPVVAGIVIGYLDGQSRRATEKNE